MLLTTFAIQWTVTERLPRTPHLTVFDRLVFVCMFLLIFMAVGSLVAAKVERENLEDDSTLADTIDRCCLGATVFLLLLSLVVLRRYVRRTSTKYGGNLRFKDGDHGAANVMRPIAGSIWRIDCSKPHDEDEQQQYWHGTAKRRTGYVLLYGHTFRTYFPKERKEQKSIKEP